jgi:F0F1-type ATP synthase assembly protein I
VSTERWPTPSAHPDDKSSDRKRRDASLWRHVAYLTSLGWMIVLPIAAGILFGRLADGALGTHPYATILLLCAGIGVALLEGFRTMTEAMKVIRHE